MSAAPVEDNQQSLFPGRLSFLIFSSYISLFVSQGLLVTAVQKQNIHGFDSVVVVLLTELVKLAICIAIYLTRVQPGNPHALIHDIRTNIRLLLLYLLPAFLYCLYNNLTFINLTLFDVSTYYCLMQFRIVLTAIIYQLLFKRQLNLTQWVSLIILTSGCLIKEFSLYGAIKNSDIQPTSKSTNVSNQLTKTHSSSIENESDSNAMLKFFWATSLLLFQMFCSCFAGVYNEYLLKDSSTAKNSGVILQNVFMYFDSIICNMFVYTLSQGNSNRDMPKFDSNSSIPVMEEVSLSSALWNMVSHPLVIILILNNAILGLVTSFFLKSLNSILKTFASALELFAVTILASILFKDHIDMYTAIALILVTVAMIVYSKSPVSVAPPEKGLVSNRSPDRYEFMLIPTSED